MTSERDETWFDALYRRWHGPVLAYARRRVAEPDDLVSEVFTAAWRYRSRVPDPPLPWLLRTASNLSLHAARGDRRRTRLDAKVSAGQRGRLSDPDLAEAVVERADASTIVLLAMEMLSPSDRELLRLTAWEQLSAAESAFVLGCSEAAVRVRLHRARARLARAVGRLESQRNSHLHLTTTEVTL
ncbi:MAG: sigma-70 family RNA polymerase sigma factor [Actinomycetota bacterium]|nr:sigma-70 family RNA polymerase sigma factor [Actinomycetota bacterium]MDQ2955984.1 sigma-70 family RNA polymerase sigma factor [Actinomycetota bacterium]